MQTVTPPSIGIETIAVEPIGMLDYLIMLARHKRSLIGIPIAAGVLAAAVTYALPSVYTGTVQILPPQGQSGASALLGQLGALSGIAASSLGGKVTNETYIGMLGSRTVSDELIARFDLAKVYKSDFPSDTRRALKNATTFTNGRDGMIVIEVDDKVPQRAAALANAYAEALKRLTQLLAVTEAAKRRLFFQTQLDQAKELLAKAEVALKETQERTGLIQLSGQAQGIIEAAASIKASIASKEVALRAMRTFAAPTNPEYMRALQELAGLQAELAKVERSPNAGNGDIGVATAKVPGVALEYIRRVRDVKYFEAMFEALAKQVELAKIDEAKDSALVQVLDSAPVPDKKSKPRRSLIVLVAVFIGLLFAVGRALFKEMIREARQAPGTAMRLEQLKTLSRLRRAK